MSGSREHNCSVQRTGDAIAEVYLAYNCGCNSLTFSLHVSDLDALRTETQTAQHESATAASQTAAMMSLNLKLQSSASKNQARNIELEVKRIESREARELLNIVQVRLISIISNSLVFDSTALLIL